MKTERERTQNSNWASSVLTDVHFWVPVVVLVGGLLLLSSFR